MSAHQKLTPQSAQDVTATLRVQPIREIVVFIDADSEPVYYRVGRQGVTRIEAIAKPGLHCDIPYVQVWTGQTCEAEFCQHNIIGVYYDPAVQA